jgi:hypothetical protein
VKVEDIAHHLGNQCRYTGATREFYSVAQHSCHVSELVEPRLKIAALLHDASEYVMLDMSRPIKYEPYFGKAFRGAQKRAEAIVETAFNLNWLTSEDHAAIKKADNQMLARERYDLLPRQGVWEILEGIQPPDFTITPWSPKKARRMFMTYYERYTRG